MTRLEELEAELAEVGARRPKNPLFAGYRIMRLGELRDEIRRLTQEGEQ